MIEITALRAMIGQQLGYTVSTGWFSSRPFGGSIADYGSLSPQQQITLDNASNAYIISHPTEFTIDQVRTAAIQTQHPQQNIQPTISQPITSGYGSSDIAADVITFGNAAIDEAGELAQGIKKSFLFGVGGFVLIGALAVTAPYWLPKVKEAFAK